MEDLELSETHFARPMTKHEEVRKATQLCYTFALMHKNTRAPPTEKCQRFSLANTFIGKVSSPNRRKWKRRMQPLIRKRQRRRFLGMEIYTSNCSKNDHTCSFSQLYKCNSNEKSQTSTLDKNAYIDYQRSIQVVTRRVNPQHIRNRKIE